VKRPYGIDPMQILEGGRSCAGLTAVALVRWLVLLAVAVASIAAAQPIYWCPMHPDVRGKAGDTCPICRMALVPATASDYRAYQLDVDITPAAIRSGQRAHVRFLVRNPHTAAIVRRFEPVHERVFHLFIVSRDLEYFAHVHPTLRPDGALDVDITVPGAGAYQLIADFMPVGGAPQLIQKWFVTAGYGGPVAAVPRLTADVTDKVASRSRVALTMPPPIAGREGLITFEVSDQRTGRPVDDLEPYLGATGHLLIVSDDLEIAAHSHPVAAISSAGGPTIVFQTVFPRAGIYRMWIQFQRAGEVCTVPFTVSIAPR
jgi:hypothetical protein